jgi:hypothetical protein
MIKIIIPESSRRRSILGAVSTLLAGIAWLWEAIHTRARVASNTSRLMNAGPFWFWSMEVILLFASAAMFLLSYAYFSNLRRLRKEAQPGAPVK